MCITQLIRVYILWIFLVCSISLMALLSISGNSMWTAALPWSGQIEYARAPWKKFEVNGIEAGLVTGFKNLNFVKVCKLTNF